MDLQNINTMVVEAAARIKEHVRHTPLDVSHSLSNETGAKVYLKLENEQVTGSFKARGALNKLSLMLASGKYRQSNPPTTASTGNHALACAYAQKVLNMKIKIFVPENISPAKDSALKLAGADLNYHGTDTVEGEIKARKTAEESGTSFVSPYNDVEVMMGQGTIGLEILEDLPDVEAVFVSVGGGGLISGIASYVKSVNPQIKVVGCQPCNSKVMYESVKVGRIIEEESLETLSDGTAGGIEEDPVTFPYCQKYVDDWVLVDEASISRGVFSVLENHHKVIEGAGGVVVAAFRQVAAQYQGQKVVLVMCGANIGVDTLKKIIEAHQK